MFAATDRSVLSSQTARALARMSPEHGTVLSGAGTVLRSIVYGISQFCVARHGWATRTFPSNARRLGFSPLESRSGCPSRRGLFAVSYTHLTLPTIYPV